VTASLSFRLDDGFIGGFIGKQPEWGPIGYVTYKRTYARPLDTLYVRHSMLAALHELVETEEFWLTLTRVVEGTFSILKDHCRSLRLPWNEERAQAMAQCMFLLMWEFKYLPPGRGLWAMGAPVVAKVGGAALNNCAFVSTGEIDTDFSAPFCFLMDMSMLGVGVGGDTRGAGKVQIVSLTRTVEPHVVEDTREGWVALVRRVLDSFVGKDTYPDVVDYSQVREAGSLIRTFGGTASGPKPLRELVESLTTLLIGRVGQMLTSSDIVDIFNLIGRCVVAGNVRRSAEIMFGDLADDAFLELKDKEKHAAALDGWRWASNNSILAEVGQSYSKHARLTAKNGEPGYFWLENARSFGRMGRAPDHKDADAMGGNPCLEQTLESFELCCLVETFPARHRGLKDYLATLKMAYLYAKAVTLVPTHDPRTNAVLLRNRRIGCSMSGIVQAIKKFGRRDFFEICDSGYGYLEDVDREYSRWLCVPESVKKTSVKPSGTVSLLCGATPGIHYPHSRYYWRVIRLATDSWIVPILREAGYPCHEIDPAKEPNTVAVYFPVEVDDFDRGERDVSMWEQLENAAQMQTYWADNQVSVTVKFDPKTEGPQIRAALELYEVRLKGVSFLPHDDHGYDHAPYQEITREQYEEARAGLKPYDLSRARHEVTERFCDGDTCVL
jgi:ribonucleoside-triphosphate reductase